jgi:FKBP-type peptidyl-prolyl cis-trans isomerase SlyD
VRKKHEEGELVDFSGQSYPLRILFGNGKMLPYFKEQLEDKTLLKRTVFDFNNF